MSNAVSKQRRAYCRKLYLAGLIANARHDLRSLQELTGMPRRTIQDTLVDLSDIGIGVQFVQDGPRYRHGFYAITEWGDHDPNWIDDNAQMLANMVGDSRA